VVRLNILLPLPSVYALDRRRDSPWPRGLEGVWFAGYEETIYISSVIRIVRNGRRR